MPEERKREHPKRSKKERRAPAGRRREAPEPARPAASAATAPEETAVPGAAVVARRAADRLRAGHVWVYRSDVEALADPESGAGLMPVTDRRGSLLGTALYSPASEIALRLVSQELLADEAEWLDLLRTRLRAAIARRAPMLNAENDACRLVFSEADELPGLTADRYAGLVIVQLRHKALDSTAVRTAVAETIREAAGPELQTVLEREDPRIRELEQLSAPASAVLWARDADDPVTSTVFRLNGLQFHFDATSGQKTGAFLDQRDNYAAAASYARGEALDVCTYQGGFALHLARACERVTGVDVSRAALEVAENNLELNRASLRAEVDWVEADAFGLLRDWSDAGTQYDTIVLDPPAFAKTRRAVEGAVRGYRELNLRALKMLRPGGRLVTCSCSHHVGLAEFLETVRAAAGDARRRLRLLDVRGAAADHPVVLNIPETEYLKCVVVEAE
jgi:23S rRNA (cytosine1962-C5)-methyltransferase